MMLMTYVAKIASTTAAASASVMYGLFANTSPVTAIGTVAGGLVILAIAALKMWTDHNAIQKMREVMERENKELRDDRDYWRTRALDE